MENQDRKRLLIIDAALKRFAHYGLAKTTMTEIAKDIAFSKALLYYYFPDKLSLYVNVVEYLMHSISKDLLKSVDKAANSAEGIIVLIQKRQAYIQKYYKLIEYTKFISPDLPNELQDKFTRARAFEMKIINNLINKGNASGEFDVSDVSFTTEIFVDAISGIHFNILSRAKIIYPDKEQFKLIFSKEKRFTEIFLEGIKVHH